MHQTLADFLSCITLIGFLLKQLHLSQYESQLKCLSFFSPLAVSLFQIVNLLEFMARNVLTPHTFKTTGQSKVQCTSLAVTQLSPTLLAFTAASAAFPTEQEAGAPREAEMRGDTDSEREGCREQKALKH